MTDEALKNSTPREKYIKAFPDGFLARLKLCLEAAVEKRKVQLLKTTCNWSNR